MDLEISEEHAALRATVGDFAQNEVAPVIAELDERGEVPYDLVCKMGAMGLFGVPIPEAHAGMGGDYFGVCLALEELQGLDEVDLAVMGVGRGLGVDDE